MKRCTLCGRTYPDDQNFCFDDGSTLEAAAPAGPFDQSEAPTANYPYPGGGAPPTDMRHVAPTAGNRPPGTMPPPYPPSPTPPYMTPQYAPRKRSPLPWILVGLGVLIIGVGLIVFLASRNSGRSSVSTGPTPGVTPGTTPRTTPSYTPSSTPSGSWQTVSGEGFTISMPGSPAHTDSTVPSAVGPLPIHLYTLSEGYEIFSAGYTEFPEALVSNSDAEQMLDTMQQGSVTNMQGEVTSQRSITLDGYPGKEVVGNSPSKNLGFTFRFYMVKPKLYMLIYTQYGKDKPASESGTRFLDSFELTK